MLQVAFSIGIARPGHGVEGIASWDHPRTMYCPCFFCIICLERTQLRCSYSSERAASALLGLDMLIEGDVGIEKQQGIFLEEEMSCAEVVTPFRHLWTLGRNPTIIPCIASKSSIQLIVESK
jgi:hypothetical protein